MKTEILYEFKALYRGDFRITGYRFGSGEKSVCVVGNTRGNEYQQLFCCSQLIHRLKELERRGRLLPGHEILVIPCANPYSINTKKRFWGIDNTDINRMFPGYDLGETTQRIAAGLFDAVKDYRVGIQFCSFYMSGSFVPHVRMMRTGYENLALAKEFGLPYVAVRNPRPFDTTTLNYNWQIWETDAFSLYTSNTEHVDPVSAKQAVEAILRFLAQQGILRYGGGGGYRSQLADDESLVTVRAETAGFLSKKAAPGDEVCQGELLAELIDTYEGDVIQSIYAPCGGVVFYACDEDLIYSGRTVYKLVKQAD